MDMRPPGINANKLILLINFNLNELFDLCVVGIGIFIISLKTKLVFLVQFSWQKLVKLALSHQE